MGSSAVFNRDVDDSSLELGRKKFHELVSEHGFGSHALSSFVSVLPSIVKVLKCSRSRSP